MKLKTLERIVKSYAFKLQEDAAYSGSYNDGGCQNLINRFEKYKNNMVIERDLRPSEFKILDDIEVGEPLEFSKEIQTEKMKLINTIKL